MTGEIKGAQYPIQKVFSDDFAFSIPDYQRPFSWGTEQASELYEDLKLAMGDRINQPEAIKPYFLGTIVLVKEDDKPDADIVDGQQRLISLTILLAALRVKHPDGDASGLTLYIHQEPVPAVGREGRYRVKLRPNDEYFFARNIQYPGTIAQLDSINDADLPDSQKQMVEVAKYFNRKLATEQAEYVKRLTEFVLTKCMLVVVSTSDFNSAFTIFTVLNNRGLDLSTVDVIKSRILGQSSNPDNATPTSHVMYVDQWENLEQSLGRSGMEDLISHIRIIYQKSARPRGTILQGFMDDILEPHKANPFAVIDDIMSPLGKALHTIKNSNYRNNGNRDAVRQVNHLLGWLNRLGNSDWVPPAMLYLSKHANEPELLSAFLQKLERLGAMFLILGLEPTGRAKRYRGVIQAVEGGNEKIILQALEIQDDEKARMRRQFNKDIYTRNSTIRSYILLRLNDTLTEPLEFARGGAGYPSGITIEHVLPQTITPGSPWLTESQGCWKDANERKKWVNRLGNLALLSQPINVKAANKPFLEKKGIYVEDRQSGTSFPLTDSVLRENDWSVDVVARRQQSFVDKLTGVWKL